MKSGHSPRVEKGGDIVATKGRLYLGLGRYILPIPPCLMRMGAAGSARQADRVLARLSPEHHLVRDFVVTEIPRKATSLSAEYIARRLGLAPGRVRDIIDELEKGKVFLFRNEHGEVTWAYPVTAEPTPHHVTFSTGERIYAA
jgi:hypothetical protein